MKKISIIFILIVSIFSCEKIDKTTDFDMSYSNNFVIPADSPTQTSIQIEPFIITTNIASTSEKNGSSLDLIDKISLHKIKLTITSPANANFDFLSDIDLYIKADGLPKIRMAWKNDMQNNLGNSINLILLGDDIKTYFKKEHIEIIPYINNDEVPLQDYHIKIDISLSVKANLLES